MEIGEVGFDDGSRAVQVLLTHGRVSYTQGSSIFAVGKKRREQVQRLIHAHLDLVGQTVLRLDAMIGRYLGGDKSFKEDSKAIDGLEHEADRARHDIEDTLEGSRMLRAYREDYLELAESVDRVANKAEEAADTLTLVRPKFPRPLDRAVKELSAETMAAWKLVPPLIDSLIREEDGLAAGLRWTLDQGVKAIRRAESRVDKLQFDTTRGAYKHEALNAADRLEILIVLERLAAVTDRIENVADRISLIASRRKLI